MKSGDPNEIFVMLQTWDDKSMNSVRARQRALRQCSRTCQDRVAVLLEGNTKFRVKQCGRHFTDKYENHAGEQHTCRRLRVPVP